MLVKYTKQIKGTLIEVNSTSNKMRLGNLALANANTSPPPHSTAIPRALFTSENPPTDLHSSPEWSFRSEKVGRNKIEMNVLNMRGRIQNEGHILLFLLPPPNINIFIQHYQNFAKLKLTLATMRTTKFFSLMLYSFSAMSSFKILPGEKER